MSMPTPVVVFPEALVGEWTAIDTRTAPGLYAYRHLQAVHLPELPDFGGGDLDAAKREITLQLRLTPQTTCRARFIPWRGGARRLHSRLGGEASGQFIMSGAFSRFGRVASNAEKAPAS